MLYQHDLSHSNNTESSSALFSCFRLGFIHLVRTQQCYVLKVPLFLYKMCTRGGAVRKSFRH